MTLRARPMVRLNLEPDGYGFVYGKVWDAQGDVHDVNILPPVPLWRGQTMLKGFEPDASDWVLYLDGEEIARVSSGAQLERLVVAHLPAPEDEREM